MDNKFKNVKIEYHILQSFPVSCLNRDDVGSPKSAFIGGVKRARVSSQCWKRQVRLTLHDSGVQIAVRTKRVFDMIMSFLEERRDDAEIAERAKIVAEALSDDTLLFLSKSEAKKLAEFVIEGDVSNFKDKKKIEKLPKTISSILKDEYKKIDGLDGLDIALFGRMVAKAPVLDVEAAASFSHSITTHKVSSEVDFFTAVDDEMPEDCSGSGHMGAIEFVSGTFYRYVSLNLGLLYDSLEDDHDMQKAVEAFTKALFFAVPSARQKTLAGYCPWDYAHIYVRKGQELQLSFDEPVKPRGDGFLLPSIDAMEKKLYKNELLMGSLFGKLGEYVYGDSEKHGIDGLLAMLTGCIREI